MSLQAYQKTLQSAENPRETEFRLFGQVTHALLDAKEHHRTNPKFIAAIDWNRRMWGALASDCAGDGNGLSEQLRAQIISLSIWVSKYSSDVMRNGIDIDPLIDINKTIMEGLSGKS